jgi:hypothetical protein
VQPLQPLDWPIRSRDALLPALAFAEDFARDMPVAVQPPPPAHPLLRLEAQQRVRESAVLLKDVLLLACLPEAHEGFATLCRSAAPEGLPLPTGALALHWLESESEAGPTMALPTLRGT